MAAQLYCFTSIRKRGLYSVSLSHSLALFSVYFSVLFNDLEAKLYTFSTSITKTKFPKQHPIASFFFLDHLFLLASKYSLLWKGLQKHSLPPSYLFLFLCLLLKPLQWLCGLQSQYALWITYAPSATSNSVREGPFLSTVYR